LNLWILLFFTFIALVQKKLLFNIIRLVSHGLLLPINDLLIIVHKILWLSWLIDNSCIELFLICFRFNYTFTFIIFLSFNLWIILPTIRIYFCYSCLLWIKISISIYYIWVLNLLLFFIYNSWLNRGLCSLNLTIIFNNFSVLILIYFFRKSLEIL